MSILNVCGNFPVYSHFRFNPQDTTGCSSWKGTQKEKGKIDCWIIWAVSLWHLEYTCQWVGYENWPSLWRIMTNKFQEYFRVSKIQILTFHLLLVFTVNSLVSSLAYSNTKAYSHFHFIHISTCSYLHWGIRDRMLTVVCEVGLRF